MLQRLFWIWLLLSFGAYNLFGQVVTGNLIESIEFEGLKKTKSSFLEDYILATPGTNPNDSLLQLDVQRLKNLTGIGQAAYRIDTLNGALKLVFDIEEVKTLLPIINFGGIQNNIWFRLGFTDINWMGRGQTLSSAYQYNDRLHSGIIYFRVPRIRGSPWGGSLSIMRWASREPLFFDEGTVNYDYTNTSFGFTTIRNFGYNRKLEAGGNFFIENYTKSEEQFLENPPGPDEATQPKILTKLEYAEDFINYHFFYLDGFSWQATGQNVYSTKDKVWFNSLILKGHQYLMLGKTSNFAFRQVLGISSNEDSPFAPFVADSYVNLRGVGNRIDRGTAQFVLNTEYRQTIFHNKWALQAVAFSDFGTWRNPGGQLEDLFDPDQFRLFVGGGIRLIYPKVYGAVLRIDYGVGVFDSESRGFVIGFGQYF